MLIVPNRRRRRRLTANILSLRSAHTANLFIAASSTVQEINIQFMLKLACAGKPAQTANAPRRRQRRCPTESRQYRSASKTAIADQLIEVLATRWTGFVKDAVEHV